MTPAELKAITDRLRGGVSMSEQAVLDCVGLVINEALFFQDTLHLVFDTKRLKLTHDSPDCCAVKYLVCDDDLAFIKGAEFRGIVVKDVQDISAGSDSHEVQFADVVTSKGTAQLAAHNENNGYYCGISFEAELVPE